MELESFSLVPDPRTFWSDFIARNNASLQTMITHFVLKCGLAKGFEAKEIACEILSDVTIIVLARPDHFDPTRRPDWWLKGIAKKLILRRCVKKWGYRRGHLRGHRHPELQILARDRQSETLIFEQLAEKAHQREGIDRTFEIFEEALTLLSIKEREFVRLIRLELPYMVLAQHMGISLMSLYKRRSRLIKHMRRLVVENQ